jgi:hypothetical protein
MMRNRKEKNALPYTNRYIASTSALQMKEKRLTKNFEIIEPMDPHKVESRRRYRSTRITICHTEEPPFESSITTKRNQKRKNMSLVENPQLIRTGVQERTSYPEEGTKTDKDSCSTC